MRWPPRVDSDRSAHHVDDLTVEGYWDSAEGKWLRHIQRHMRTRRFIIPGEPIQKDDRRAKRREAEIRAQVAQELGEFRRSTLTGPLALSLHFSTARRQPPDLPKLAKYLLDVLGLPKSGPKKGPALYRDDSQVKMLHVVWSHADNEKESGSTYILARPLRDVVDDLRLAREIDLSDSYDDSDSPFTSRSVDNPDWYDYDDDLGFLPPELQEWLRRFNRKHHQEFLLQHTGALLRASLAGAPEWIAGARPRRRPRAFEDPRFRAVWDQISRPDNNSWSMLISQPLTIPMPSLPARQGEDAMFRTELKEQLKEFARKWSVMVPLEEPLNVTILVVPPIYGHTSPGQGREKDLDNLASVVVPALRNVFRQKIPSPKAIINYQVIQLTRQPNDAESGYLRVVLGMDSLAHVFRSDWDWIAEYVDDHVDDGLGYY